MKTLEQFVKDNEGQFLEVAGSSNAKFQCVDCVNGYIRDVLGLPIIEWTNAIDFKNKANGNYEVIYNDINNPNIVPDVGDIVVYKHPNGIGHIGFCIKKGTASQFGIFEQNWPVGSPCKSVLNKKYIIGDYVVDYWMRPKSIIQDMTENEKKLLDIIKDKGLSEGDLRWVADLKRDQTVPKLEKKVTDLESSLKDLTSRLDILESENKANNELIISYQSTITTAKNDLEEKSKEIQMWKTRYENKLKETPDKLSTFELFRLAIKSLLKK